MGVGFSHCKASWSYGGFNDFRAELAEMVGIDLWQMRGFSHSPRKGNGSEGIEWPAAETEPLIHLLNHSDCEDDLSPEQCRAIAPRLAELCNRLADGYDRDMGAELAKGMALAAQKNERLEFC